jgi:hypothetical protein
MSNMSYCRFRNTKSDLEDCVNELQNMIDEGNNPLNELSTLERQAMMIMTDLCHQFIELVEEGTNIKEDSEDEAYV